MRTCLLRKPVPCKNKYVGLYYCRVEMYASHADHDKSRWVYRRDRRTDGRTPDRYITLSVTRNQHKNRTIIVWSLFGSWMKSSLDICSLGTHAYFYRSLIICSCSACCEHYVSIIRLNSMTCIHCNPDQNNTSTSKEEIAQIITLQIETTNYIDYVVWRVYVPWRAFHFWLLVTWVSSTYGCRAI